MSKHNEEDFVNHVIDKFEETVDKCVNFFYKILE